MEFFLILFALCSVFGVISSVVFLITVYFVSKMEGKDDRG